MNWYRNITNLEEQKYLRNNTLKLIDLKHVKKPNILDIIEPVTFSSLQIECNSTMNTWVILYDQRAFSTPTAGPCSLDYSRMLVLRCTDPAADELLQRQQITAPPPSTPPPTKRPALHVSKPRTLPHKKKTFQNWYLNQLVNRV